MNDEELEELINEWALDYGLEITVEEVQNLVQRMLEGPASVDTH